MRLTDLIYRNLDPAPWADGDNLPWNDPEFSLRMLGEHLTQEHDLASRRFDIIDQHVQWIHENLLKGNVVPVLDLGCGPGLYTSRLSQLGHACTGIDFSPASIDYARQLKQTVEAPCNYVLGDVRATDFGEGYGLAMMIYGEFNVFRPNDAQLIANKVFKALLPHGEFLLEVSTMDALYDMGHEPPTWYSAPEGLFSNKPHLCLLETFYNKNESITTQRYYIIELETAEVRLYSTSYRALTHSEYQNFLQKSGFINVRFYDSLNPFQGVDNNNLMVVVAQKPGK